MTLGEFKELRIRHKMLGVPLLFDEFNYTDYGKTVRLNKWKSKDKVCVVPEFINNICSDAFSDCDWLEEIDLSKSSVKILPDAIFKNLNIKRIKFNNFIDIIPKYCCMNTKLEYVFIPNSVRIIEEAAFKYCTDLKVVNFESDSNLSTLKNSVFYNSGLVYFYAPDSLERIHARCFFDCKNLKEVYLGSSLRNLNAYSLSYCNSLEKVVMKKDSPLKIIQQYTFVNSINLKEVILGDNVVSFSEYAFMGCKNLVSININEETLNRVNYTAFIDTPLYLKFRVSSSV